MLNKLFVICSEEISPIPTDDPGPLGDPIFPKPDEGTLITWARAKDGSKDRGRRNAGWRTSRLNMKVLLRRIGRGEVSQNADARILA
jgi:hypothetical protein